MSELIILGYDDHDTAKRAYDQVQTLQRDYGSLDKSGIDNAFRQRVQSMLTPGKAAVVVMASKITEDKFASAMQPYGGQSLQTSLSEADERELAAELGGQQSSGSSTTS